MTAQAVIRYTVLVLSAAVAVAGVLMMVDWFSITRMPGNMRVIFGSIVMLYGIYRFVVAYFRKP